MEFNRKYFLLTIAVFITEVLIALCVHDRIIRPYIGDVLVVILIYSFIKAFINLPVLKTAIGVVIFSYLIEYLQYLNFVKLIGLGNSKLANIVLGNYFTWADILAYTVGFVTILIAERKSIINGK